MSERISPYPGHVLPHAAGFFDGEGCVCLTISKSGTAQLWASVANTNRDILDYFCAVFGGRVHSKISKNKKCKDAFVWKLSTTEAVPFLKKIKPWIIIKREQIALAEHFFDIRNTSNREASEHYHEYVLKLKYKMNWLNRKGNRSPQDIDPIPYRTGSIWATNPEPFTTIRTS